MVTSESFVSKVFQICNTENLMKNILKFWDGEVFGNLNFLKLHLLYLHNTETHITVYVYICSYVFLEKLYCVQV